MVNIYQAIHGRQSNKQLKVYETVTCPMVPVGFPLTATSGDRIQRLRCSSPFHYEQQSASGNCQTARVSCCSMGARTTRMSSPWELAKLSLATNFGAQTGAKIRHCALKSNVELLPFTYHVRVGTAAEIYTTNENRCATCGILVSSPARQCVDPRQLSSDLRVCPERAALLKIVNRPSYAGDTPPVHSAMDRSPCRCACLNRRRLSNFERQNLWSTDCRISRREMEKR
jgi:hypothetical protein